MSGSCVMAMNGSDTVEYRLHSDDGYTKVYHPLRNRGEDDTPLCHHSRFMWCEHCLKLSKYQGPPPTPEELKNAGRAIKQTMKLFGIDEETN